jgi:hypothetical protein
MGYKKHDQRVVFSPGVGDSKQRGGRQMGKNGGGREPATSYRSIVNV